MKSLDRTVEMSMSDAEEAVRASLATQGFGVLTEIDVAATLKAKLDIDREPMKILGACNPGFAHKALEMDPTISLLLPCNVVLSAADGGRTQVSMVDPRALIDDPAFAELADEAAQSLQAALDAL